jgi:hypothetical protein
MRERLLKRFRENIKDNHPDLLLNLLEENRLEEYLHEQVNSVDKLIDDLTVARKAPSAIEDICIDELTKPLRPSRYNYLHDLLQEEFPDDFERLGDKGILTTELINMIASCEPVFDELKFCEANEDDRYLRYAMMGAVYEYLNSET